MVSARRPLSLVVLDWWSSEACQPVVREAPSHPDQRWPHRLGGSAVLGPFAARPKDHPAVGGDGDGQTRSSGDTRTGPVFLRPQY